MSIKLTCDDEQNLGFEALDREADASERFMLRSWRPKCRLKLQPSATDGHGNYLSNKTIVIEDTLTSFDWEVLENFNKLRKQYDKM